MARKLQDRLALANYKAQNDLEGMSFAVVEAHLATVTKRKKDASSIAASSDTSSTSSDHQFFSNALDSSPITAPFFSDDTYELQGAKVDRRRFYGPLSSDSHPEARKRLRTHSMAPPLLEPSRSTWKAAHNLPDSSPVYHRQTSKFSTSQGPNLSFVSGTSTVPDTPPMGSQDDRQEPSHHSFTINTSNFHSSPPRTPPPTRSCATRKRKGNAGAEEGADLLLYLATSPSPANPGRKSRVPAPSTPPTNAQVLPSSMMSTPGLGGFMAGFSTPGTQFNFSDFVNVTPSPAQGAFGNRTPGLAKTPLAAKEARRRLNFESSAPPSGTSSHVHRGRGSTGKETGLGMELGGELIS